MSLDKVSAALKLLSEDAKGILALDTRIPCPCDHNAQHDTSWKSVRENLVEKHLLGQTAVTDSLLVPGSVTAPCYDPILFEQLTGYLIKWAALCTQDASSPSSVDAYVW